MPPTTIENSAQQNLSHSMAQQVSFRVTNRSHDIIEVGPGKKIWDGSGTGTRPGSVPAIFSGPVREQISMYVEYVCTWLTHY
jgi:hypothetical protein